MEATSVAEVPVVAVEVLQEASPYEAPELEELVMVEKFIMWTE